jgi:hypothetical protein
MGAHGTGPFENDGALDLQDELRELDPDGARERLLQALDAVARVPNGEYLEKDEGEAGVAAAAIVAASRAGDEELLKAADLESVVPTDLGELVDVAIRALNRVISAESELNAIWSGTTQYGEWRTGIDNILAALRGNSG